MAEVFYFDLYGKREYKYDFLNSHEFDSIPWQKVSVQEPGNYFVPKDFKGQDDYEKGFKIDELMSVNASGIKTQRDDASICFSETDCQKLRNDFLNLSEAELANKYGYKNVRDWQISLAQKDLKEHKIIANKISYRPFDTRYMNYTGITKGIMGYPRLNVMQHMLKGENFALCTCRQQSTFKFQHVLITDSIADICYVSLQTGETGYLFPLYLYPDNDESSSLEFSEAKRTPNLNMQIVNRICAELNIKFIPDEDDVDSRYGLEGHEVATTLVVAEGESRTPAKPDTYGTNVTEVERPYFTPLDLLDYIYAVLHKPSYREQYKEFLKIDFPRVPYPTDKKQFFEYAKVGAELRELHLMKSPAVSKLVTKYPEAGENLVEKIEAKDGKVFINKTQYFDSVPTEAWEFFVGGYQPLQKYLKDRKGRALTAEEIMQWQRIVVVLLETQKVMEKLENM